MPVKISDKRMGIWGLPAKCQVRFACRISDGAGYCLKSYRSGADRFQNPKNTGNP